MTVKLPKIGARLDAYNDGKLSPNRLKVVVVDDVIHRNDFSKKALRLWFKAIREDWDKLMGGYVHYVRGPQQFWDWNCQHFIVGHMLNDGETVKDPMLFAQRPSGEWYGVNWNYLLDVSGNVRKRNHKDWRICAEECNQVMKWNRKEGRYEYFDMLIGKKIPEED